MGRICWTQILILKTILIKIHSDWLLRYVYYFQKTFSREDFENTSLQYVLFKGNNDTEKLNNQKLLGI